TYDSLGRILTMVQPNPAGGSFTTSYTYDKDGSMLSATDPNANETQYVYDARGRQIEVIAPDPDGSGPLTSPITYSTYDAAGQLTSTTTPTHYAGEIQRLYFGSSTSPVTATSLVSGTFSLQFGAQTTATIAYNASATTVQADLAALTNIGSGNV